MAASSIPAGTPTSKWSPGNSYAYTPSLETTAAMASVSCTSPSAPGLVVSETDVREAVRFAFRQLRLVVEPGGAAGLAALLAGKVEAAGRTTAVVLSGGNVDPAVFATIQAESS